MESVAIDLAIYARGICTRGVPVPPGLLVTRYHVGVSSSVLEGLPRVMVELLELSGEPEGEARAECENCPMVKAVDRAAGPRSFHPDIRCCGVHPQLANVLVGRALRAGGYGADALRDRIGERDGVSPWGIYPPADVHARYEARAPHGFGTDDSLRCPFLQRKTQLCRIWRHRPGVCRLWFCKHDAGKIGAVAWSDLESVLWRIQNALAFLLVELGDPVRFGESDPAGWSSADYERWFSWCATRADTLSSEELRRLRSAAIESTRAAPVDPSQTALPPMPKMLVPSVSEIIDGGDAVHLVGYSDFDAVMAPRAVFAFLASLDGVTEWRLALEAAGGAVDESLVRELYRVGALSPRE